MNNQRYVTVSFVGASVVAWLLARQITDVLWGFLRLPMPQDLPVTPADAIGVVAAVIVFIILRRHTKVNQFVNEVFVELAKVTWPPRKETMLSTVVIVIMVAICSMIIFGFDTLWGTVIKVLY